MPGLLEYMEFGRFKLLDDHPIYHIYNQTHKKNILTKKSKWTTYPPPFFDKSTATSFRTIGSSSDPLWSSSTASSTLAILATPPLLHFPSESQPPVGQTTSPGLVRHFTVNTQSLVPGASVAAAEVSMAAAALALKPVSPASDLTIGDCKKRERGKVELRYLLLWNFFKSAVQNSSWDWRCHRLFQVWTLEYWDEVRLQLQGHALCEATLTFEGSGVGNWPNNREMLRAPSLVARSWPRSRRSKSSMKDLTVSDITVLMTKTTI